MGRIVVGVDGSEGSKKALKWAANEASLRGDTLEVVHTYEYEVERPGYDHIGAAARNKVTEITPGGDVVAKHAQDMVDRMVSELTGIEAEAHAVESDHPAQTLVEHAKGADMLVVGSRGRGNFKSLMLGSVSQHCAHHADCPVVILRPTES